MFGPFHGYRTNRRHNFFHPLDRRNDYPMVKDAFLRVGWMRFCAHYLTLFRRHGNREIGEQRAVKIIHQLLIAHVDVVTVPSLRAQTSLGLNNGLSYIRRPAFKICWIKIPGARYIIQRTGHLSRLKRRIPSRGLMPLHPHGVMSTFIHFEQRVR